jgi:glutaredoxin
MRHFNYFENGGPAPSSCISCGAVKELLEIGQLAYGGMAQVCVKCVKELATFVGYAEEYPLQEIIKKQQDDARLYIEQLAKVPNLVDGLINGIRSSVTDFVFAVSYSNNADKPEPVQDVAVDDSGTDKNIKTPAGRKQAPSKSIVE